MESSTTSFKDNEKPSNPTRATVYPPEVYPPPPHCGGRHPPTGYTRPSPMPGYGGHPLPPPPFPPPYNTGPYAPPPHAYGYPHYPPPTTAYSYAPPPGYRPASNKSTKKKKSGMSKILGMGVGLVGGLLLGELAADAGAAPSFDLFSDPTGGGGMDYDASMQSVSDSMDLLGTIG